MKVCFECGEEMYDDVEGRSCDRCVEETIEGNEALDQHAKMVADWMLRNPDQLFDHFGRPIKK